MSDDLSPYTSDQALSDQAGSDQAGSDRREVTNPLPAAAFDEPILVTETVDTRPTPSVDRSPDASESTDETGGGKLKAAAIATGVAAVAQKVRKRAPQKVKDLRAKRAAGRCVILAELAGRQIAIGPYRNAEAAQQSMSRVAGAPQIVEVMPEQAFFDPGR